MNYQIDQSGKVEDTSKDTVVAYANDSIGAVILSAKEKRRLQELFRQAGTPRLFIDYVFSALLITLLRSVNAQHVTVDIEYPGHTKVIDALVARSTLTTIRWQSIGKHSSAHDIAYKVYKKKLAIGGQIDAQDVWRVTKKITGGRLKTGLSPANRRSAPVTDKSVSGTHKKVKGSKSRRSL